jgi:hypothetical protein
MPAQPARLHLDITRGVGDRNFRRIIFNIGHWNRQNDGTTRATDSVAREFILDAQISTTSALKKDGHGVYSPVSVKGI